MNEKTQQFSPDWWMARRQIEDAIAAQSRRRKVQWTDAEVRRSDNAKRCALGEEEACKAYERNGFTREQWLAKWNPEGKTSGYIPTDFGK